MRARWLDRRIAAPGPYLTLCLSEQEYEAAMRHCKVRRPPDWCTSDAATHYLTSDKGLTCVVSLRNWQGRNPIEVAGLLVHEAVHCWQAYAEAIGERAPGAEQEAYAVQAVAQELMAEFARRMAK